MAMKTPPPGRELTFPLADINLLPLPYQPKPISLTKVMGIPGGVALIGLIAPMVIMMQGVSTNIDAVKSNLDSTNQLIAQKTQQKTALTKQVNDLKTQAGTVKASADKITLVSEYLVKHQEYTKGDLMIVLSKVNPSIQLNSVSVAEGSLTITGLAPNQQDIFTYAQDILKFARSLDLSDRYTQTTISSLRAIPPKPNDPDPVIAAGQIQFTLTLARGGK
jgi:hypothetical protein